MLTIRDNLYLPKSKSSSTHLKVTLTAKLTAAGGGTKAQMGWMFKL